MEQLGKWIAWIPCHRRLDRCIRIKGEPFPLCARCMSILLGYGFIPILLLFSLTIPWWIGILCQLPMLIDGITQYYQWRESTNRLRMITGLISGFGLSVLVIVMSNYLVKWIEAFI